MLSNAKIAFESDSKVDTTQDKHVEVLERKVGQLLIENDFLKKLICRGTEERQKMITANHEALSIRQQ